jgi:aerobic carbon-monoxide dehydrogenase large subunit
MPELVTPRYVGSDQRKLNGDRFLRGSAQYINDIELPGTVYLSIVRSPHAAARIGAIALGEVRADPRCLLVIDGADLAQLCDPIPHFIDSAVFGGKTTDVRALAVDQVLYEGQPVVAVVAATPGDAEDLARRVAIEWEPLPAVVDAQAALAPDARRVYDAWDDNVVLDLPFADGDYAAAAAAAPHVIEEEFATHRYSSQPIEPRGYLASYNAREQSYTFYGASQNPHPLRWVLAHALRVRESQVRVIAPHVGGGFGLKMHGHPEEVLVCALSRVLQTPVKWIEDRRETLLIGAREHVHRWAIAFDDDGMFLGFRDHFVANIGALGATPGWGMAFLTALSFPTGYKIANTDVRVQIVVTNKGPWNATRGYGKEATNLIMERAADLVAVRTGLDPAEIRRRNLVRKHEFPYKTNGGLNIDSGDYHSLVDKTLALMAYEDIRRDQERLRAQGRYLGFGLAFELTPESGDIPGTLVSGFDTSTVRMDPSGHVTLLTGVTTPGGGNDTGIAQIVADELGVPIDAIDIVQGDTDLCPYGFGNYSGRSMVVGGNAAALAARDIRAKLAAVAGVMLECDPDELAFGQGTISLPGTEKALPIVDVAYAIYTLAFAVAAGIEPRLESTRVYKPENISHVPDEHGRIQPYPTYSNAVHAAVVEVDVATGKVDLQRFGVLHDCGTVINPRFVEGQMHGAIAMGIGAALSEEQRYDGEGHLLSNRFKTYLMPRPSDVPSIEMEHQVTPSPFTLLGVKGAGEAGVGGAQAAVINAVNDAIRPLGAQLRRTPASAPNVLNAIKEARS